MANEEPMVGQKTTEEIPQDKIGQMTTEKQDEGEVGGRAIVQRMAQCSVCGRTGWIYYDTVNYRAYQCGGCGSVLIF
jgi:hypothetical protein